MALDVGEFGSQYAVHLICAQAICLSASLSQPACFFLLESTETINLDEGSWQL